MTNYDRFFATPFGTFKYKISPAFGSATITGFEINPNNKEGVVVIPDTIEGCYVDLIDKMAFGYIPSIKKVTLPPHILTISDMAFKGCSNLETINFPKSLNRIGVSAFSDCSSLKEVNLKEVTYIGPYAFSKCSAVETFNLGTKITLISTNLLTDNNNFKTFKIPESVNRIFLSAFARCDNLEEIEISKNVQSISGGAFMFLPSLKKFSVHPDNNTFFIENGALCQAHDVISREDGTHSKTYSLVAVPAQRNDAVFYIPNKINKILPYAFHGSKIHDVNIPTSVSTLCQNCFDGTVNLKKIKIPSSVVDCNFIMFENNNINTIEFMKGIKKIILTFDTDKTTLKTIKLPSTLTHAEIYDINPKTKLVFQKETEVSKKLKEDKYHVYYSTSELSKMLSEMETEKSITEI